MKSGYTCISIEKDIESIPTISANKTRLFSVLEDQNASIKDIEYIIASDPAMAAKVIKLANSSFYRHSKQSVGIHDAILTIGFDMVKCITLSISVMETFGSAAKVAEKLWHHSYAVALIAFEFGRTRNEKEWLFTGGLLHDLGRMVLISKVPDTYIPMIKEDGSWPDLNEEEETFSMDHTRIGTTVAEKWHFPPEVIAIIKNHHVPNDRLSALTYVISNTVYQEEKGIPYEEHSPAGLSKMIDADFEETRNRAIEIYSHIRESVANLV